MAEKVMVIVPRTAPALFTHERRAIRELDIVEQTASGFAQGVFCMQSWSYR